MDVKRHIDSLLSSIKERLIKHYHSGYTSSGLEQLGFIDDDDLSHFGADRLPSPRAMTCAQIDRLVSIFAAKALIVELLLCAHEKALVTDVDILKYFAMLNRILTGIEAEFNEFKRTGKNAFGAALKPEFLDKLRLDLERGVTLRTVFLVTGKKPLVRWNSALDEREKGDYWKKCTILFAFLKLFQIINA